MTQYKYQESFAEDLADSWVNGNKQHVRTTIRNLKHKAQAAYIATFIALWLQENGYSALAFLSFIHPNNR